MFTSVRSVTADDIAEFVAWRYESPFDVYNLTEPLVEAAEYFRSPAIQCHVVTATEASFPPAGRWGVQPRTGQRLLLVGAMTPLVGIITFAQPPLLRLIVIQQALFLSLFVIASLLLFGRFIDRRCWLVFHLFDHRLSSGRFAAQRACSVCAYSLQAHLGTVHPATS